MWKDFRICTTQPAFISVRTPFSSLIFEIEVIAEINMMPIFLQWSKMQFLMDNTGEFGYADPRMKLVF